MCCEGNSKNLLLELSLVLCPSVALIFVWIVTGSVPFKWQTLAVVKNINRMWEWLEPWSKRINAWLHHLDLALPSHDSLIISHDHDLSILSCVAHPVLAVQKLHSILNATCRKYYVMAMRSVMLYHTEYWAIEHRHVCKMSMAEMRMPCGICGRARKMT